jgi:hypothetical protein
MPYPNFICIGAQKAGTTWLHYQMSKHSQIWVPPIKELHVFDRTKIKRYIHYVLDRNPHGRLVRYLLLRVFTFRNPLWFIKYVFSDQNAPSFYPSLFSPNSGQICGEYTPAYGRLSLESVKRIASQMPNCKIIYLIRSPVDRAWSQINMKKRELGSPIIVSEKHLNPVKRDRMIKNSSSHTTLKYWTTSFGSKQVFVGFFEQIKDNPEGLLSSIYSFLNIDPDLDGQSIDLHIPKNKGHYNQLPYDEEQRISRLLLSEIQELHKQFDNDYTRKWLERANEVLN